MQAKELILRARLRRVQAEAVLDPAARQALLDEAEEWETLAEEQEVFSSLRQLTTQPTSLAVVRH
jgi:hypothetical protein